MNLYNNPPPTGISNFVFQGSMFNPPQPFLGQMQQEIVPTFWDEIKPDLIELGYQLAVAAIKSFIWWLCGK